MTYPVRPVPSPPRCSGADVGVSLALLALTVLFGAVAATFGVLSLAFLDHCPPATCSVDGAVNAVFTALLAAAGIGLTGLVLTIVQLARRKTAWPFALGTFVLCVFAVLLGLVAYSAAVS
ncbi:Transmembrane protein [Mycobacterium sp. smrl_JER01]